MPQSKHARAKRSRDYNADYDDGDAKDADGSHRGLATDSLTTNDFSHGKKLVHASLVEIGLDSWLDLSERFGALRNYLLIHFGEIGSILPDPMMRLRIPVYNADKNVESDYLCDVEGLSESSDPTGLKRLIAVERLNGRMERNRQYLRNRIAAYWTIRSVTSRMLDQVLSADPEFNKIEENDPIALHELIRKVLMTRHTETTNKIERPIATAISSIQNIPNQRTIPAQIMYGALMYVTHGTSHIFLITVTHPLGIILVAGVENVSTPVLRNAVNKMFGAFVSRGIQIAQFVSDNEKGLSSLFGDKNSLNVDMVTSGLGEYANRIETAIHTIKEAVIRSCFYVPFILSHQMFKLLVVSVAKKTDFLDNIAPGRDVSPLHGLIGLRVDGVHDTGSAIFTHCEIKDRLNCDTNANRTVQVLYVQPHQPNEGTHLFLRLDNRQLVTSKYYREMPVTAEVVSHVNAWSDPGKVHHYTVPCFIYHGKEVFSNDDDEDDFGNDSNDFEDENENDNENEDEDREDEGEDNSFLRPVSEQNNPTPIPTPAPHHTVGLLVGTATPLNVIDDITDPFTY
jgi:hypothetical protein